jgi:hypothetical protein
MARAARVLAVVGLVAGLTVVGVVITPTPGAAGIEVYEVSAQLAGSAEVGGGDPDGAGQAWVSFQPFGTQVCFDVEAAGIGTPTMAHIHAGDAGTNGPIVIDFAVGTNGLDGCVTSTDTQMQAILDDPAGFYVNVHTSAFSGGAIRGQLELRPTTSEDVVDEDDGLLSIREAMLSANWSDDGSTVLLGPDEVYELDRCPTGVDDDLSLDGDLDDTADGGVLVEGGGSTIAQTCDGARVLSHTSDAQPLDGLWLRDVTITGGHPAAGDQGGDGGGLHSETRVTLEHAALVGNEADDVGGGAYAGLIDVTRSYIGRNSANSAGGVGAASIFLRHSTLHENAAATIGGGAYADGVSATFTTFSGNVAGTSGDHVQTGTLQSLASAYERDDLAGSAVACEASSTVTSNGANHVSSATPGDCAFSGTGDVVGTADLGLRPVFPAGTPGPSSSFYPEPTSALIDTLVWGDSSCSGTDQLGSPRPPVAATGEGCDTGAVEWQACEDVFTDVAPDHAFCDEIAWMGATGVSTGSQPGPQYKPSPAVSRAAMSAFMYRLAGSPPFDPPGTPSFDDVSSSHPFFAEVEWMAAEEITTGFGDGTYRPGAAVSRQAMSAFMYRLASEPEFDPPTTPTFPDVGTGNQFFAEIEWMAAEEITTGFADGTYRPGAGVSRQAMAAFMYRLADGLLVGQAVAL